MKQKYRAFTLIELLVVATILAMLAVIVIVNLEKARVKARDAQRKADLTKIAGALDTYKIDSKSYIIATTFAGLSGTGNFAPVISGGYIASIPTDPISDSTHFYQYKGEVGRYKLKALSENITSGDSNAQAKAGDFYNSCTGCDVTFYQISTDATALAW